MIEKQGWQLCIGILLVSLIRVPVYGETLKEVLHLSFDSIDGQRVPDSSGNDVKSFLGVSSENNEADPVWVSEGKFGGALKFDGKGSVVTVEDSQKLHFLKGESFTVELWVKPLCEDTKARQTLVCRGSWQTNARWDFYLYTQGRLGFKSWLKEPKGHNINMLSGENSLGNWHHIAFVRDCQEGMLRFYYDNRMVREEHDTVPADQFDFPASLFIGAEYPKDMLSFCGLVDEFIITRGVKREFDISRASSISSGGEGMPYKAVAAEIQKPDPFVADSWEQLKKKPFCSSCTKTSQNYRRTDSYR